MPEGEGNSPKEKPKRVVVDVASGYTPAAIHFRDFHRREIQPDELRVGLEINHAKAQSAQNDLLNLNREHQVIRGSAKNLPFANGSVDELIYNNFFCDPDVPVLKDFFVEMARVLRQGGKVSIRDSYSPGRLLRDDWEGAFENKENLEKFFAPYSLRVTKFIDHKTLKVSDKISPLYMGAFEIELEKI